MVDRVTSEEWLTTRDGGERGGKTRERVEKVCLISLQTQFLLFLVLYYYILFKTHIVYYVSSRSYIRSEKGEGDPSLFYLTVSVVHQRQTNLFDSDALKYDFSV